METVLRIELDKLLGQVNNEFDERTQYIHLVLKFFGKLELEVLKKENSHWTKSIFCSGTILKI